MGALGEPRAAGRVSSASGVSSSEAEYRRPGRPPIRRPTGVSNAHVAPVPESTPMLKSFLVGLAGFYQAF